MELARPCETHTRAELDMVMELRVERKQNYFTWLSVGLCVCVCGVSACISVKQRSVPTCNKYL